jgi:hypothetical protein
MSDILRHRCRAESARGRCVLNFEAGGACPKSSMTERENWGRRGRWSAGATNEMNIMQKTSGSLNKLIETVNRFIKQLVLGVQVGG